MTTIHNLPDELLLRILYFIRAPDLSNFANISLRLHRVSWIRLQKHRKLQAQYRRIDFATPRQKYEFLTLVLLTDIGFYVREAYIWKTIHTYENRERWEIPGDELCLYRKAIEISPYIKEPYTEMWMRDLTSFDERVVLALLLPLLPNLETLHFASDPFWGDLKHISGVIKGIVMTPAAASPPLSKLHTVSFGNEEENGFDLSDIARFMALPNVRYVRGTRVPGYDFDRTIEDEYPSFEREEELPLSKVELCTFTSSRINADWARILVAGIEGPCMMSGNGCPYAGKPWQFHISRKTGISLLLLDNVETINLDDFPDPDEFLHVRKHKEGCACVVAEYCRG